MNWVIFSANLPIENGSCELREIELMNQGQFLPLNLKFLMICKARRKGYNPEVRDGGGFYVVYFTLV